MVVLSRALPHPPGARWLALGAALLLHALLAWWASQALHKPAAAPEQRALRLRMLPAPVSARPAEPPRTRPTPAVRRAAAAPGAAITAPAVADTAAITPPPAAAQAASVAEAPLLDSEATRRALRDAGRGPLLSERAAAATEAPALRSADEKLGDEVAKAAKGDCMKGEYAGSGMGLLSLPFLAAAALSDKCRR
jgi:hypothetical protein